MQTDFNGEPIKAGDKIELIVNYPDDNMNLRVGDRGNIYEIINQYECSDDLELYVCSVNFHRDIEGSGYGDVCPPEFSWNLQRRWFVIVHDVNDDNVDFNVDIDSFLI